MDNLEPKNRFKFIDQKTDFNDKEDGCGRDFYYQNFKILPLQPTPTLFQSNQKIISFLVEYFQDIDLKVINV